MPNPDDVTQIPASLIDISNNDMPTMHVPSRDSMYRPDLSSSIDDYIYEEEDDDNAVEYSENDELEKKSSGLLAPLSPTSYEFNQAIEGLSIEHDEDSYASEDLLSIVSIPGVNEPDDEPDDEDDEEDGEEDEDEAAYFDNKSASFHGDIIKLSADIRRGTVDINKIDKEKIYSIYFYNGVDWIHKNDSNGSELVLQNAAILFEHPYGVFLKDEPPGYTYSCNPAILMGRYKKRFVYTYDDGRAVPYFHKVVSGDIISCLSKDYRVDVKDIERINKHIYGSDWALGSIEIDDKIYLVPEDVADLIHKYGELGIFKDKCKGTLTLDADGKNYSELCDPNSDKFIGPADRGYNYLEYCKRGDTSSKGEQGYSELCDPSSEWYSGRKAGEEEDCDDEDACVTKPGASVDSGESDYRSESLKYLHEREVAKKEAEDLEERRKKAIAELKPHPMVRGWREHEAQRMAGVNETYSAYGVSLGLRLGREIYEHEVLFWEGPYNTGGNYSSVGEGRSLAEMFPLCYEKQRFESNIVDKENGVYIPAGNYSLRKCVPEEDGRRVWDHISKRLSSYREVSAAGVTIDVWKDPRDLPKNETFDTIYGEDPELDADGGTWGTDLSSPTWLSGQSDITIVGSDRKIVTSNYSIARERLLEFAAGSGLKLIMSSGMPDEERCSKDPCDGGWCMPDAMTSFMYTNTSGYDRYNIGYDPQRVDEVGNQTGWNLDPTPWVTEESGPVSIASVFTKQVMPSTDSSGPWQTLTTWGDPKTIDLKEWPHSSSEYSMQLKIVRDNSRDNRLNREQRLLKTLIDLHEESASVNQESIHKYAIYFVHPYEALNPVLGECNYIRQYYDEYIKLSGDETGVSILHANRPEKKDGSKDEHHISVAKDLSVGSVYFSHRGPKFDFYQVEEFYLKWRALSE